MKKIILNLQFIFRPAYWIMNEEYSAKWDAELNKLLEIHLFVQQDEFTATLGGLTIWVANHPYDSFVPYSFGMSNFRPSRLTIAKAMKRLKKDTNYKRIDPYDKYKKQSARYD